MKLSGMLVAALGSLALFLTTGVSLADEKGQVISITAKRFEYSPSEITLKKGIVVTLEFTSLDRLHGFNCPGLEVRTNIEPGKKNRLRIVPQKTGVFNFSCDVFCGDGHEGMEGKITVVE
jgi:cytochrome c oxidase subunit 2